MRPIGFSTGALAFADFAEGLRMLEGKPVQAVELSALRQAELVPLLRALPSLDLQRFPYISIHAPSQFEPGWEAELCGLLMAEVWRGWPIVLHPDAIHDFGRWRQLGAAICIENMDKRKPIGRTAAELHRIFEELPEATFCFDIGHARQFDPTMTEACMLLRDFGKKLRQVHISEVNTRSKHDVLSFASIKAFQEVAHLIPQEIPLILETPVGNSSVEAEVGKAIGALPAEAGALAA
jgi:hypothetical protein